MTEQETNARADLMTESLWDAMERLRLSTIAGLDRLDAMIADAKGEDDDGN